MQCTLERERVSLMKSYREVRPLCATGTTQSTSDRFHVSNNITEAARVKCEGLSKDRHTKIVLIGTKPSGYMRCIFCLKI